jgi:hypothetical protein
MQAMFGQEPPTYRRSTLAVRRPEPAMCHASTLPPWPLPRINTSSRSGSDIAPSAFTAKCTGTNVTKAKLPQQPRRGDNFYSSSE